MACVILPSEIARLVYGYLINENLNEIALRFLESSPYLKDCLQIVNSGYQFNTKLMGKELQDLLQEYSVIHNTVNKKVNLLCKTSLLYKRIKLRCESLSEILELILFWKYKLAKSAENSVTSDRNEKCSNSFINNCSEIKNTCDVPGVKVSNLNLTISGCNNSLFNTSRDESLPQNNESNEKTANLENKVTGPSFVKGSGLGVCSGTVIPSAQHDLQQDRPTKCSSIQIPEISEQFQKKISVNINDNISNVSNTVNSSKCNNTPVSSNSDSPISTLCVNSNVYTLDINSDGKELTTSDVGNGCLVSEEGTGPYESQIKIVHIEKENQNENQIVNAFSTSSRQTDNNVTLENSSVVFVSNDVGSVSVDQERNQIIVIPIDYYKTQNDIQSRIEATNNEKRDFFQPKEISDTEKNQMIFADVQTDGGNSMVQYLNEGTSKTAAVDGNILTENDFLRNRHLMYNIEKELERSNTQSQAKSQQIISKNTTQTASIPPVEGTPLIILSETINTNKPVQRYRSILPKKKKRDPILPVVVVQPLIESSQSLAKKSTSKREPVEKLTRKVKKRTPVSQKSEAEGFQSKESYNMPSIKTPVAEKSLAMPRSDEKESNVEPSTKPVENIRMKEPTEEKENLEKLQMVEVKKTETPIFVTRRNSKRLSLSTPRRRSHIRALEFETPPKTKEEKKSKTSPKAKMEKPATKVERKSVRNTLFKSPIPEISFKSSSTAMESKSNTSGTNAKGQNSSAEADELNELSIPIATRSPNTKLSDAWENLTGVGCVIGQSENVKSSQSKKMWDADLRGFISENQDVDTTEKRRVRKPEKVQRDNRKNMRKKEVVTKKSKSASTMTSPSKMSLTAKRNTYSINGNEEGSPLRSLLDDLRIVTPFKSIETIRPTEETPTSKLLRENINSIDNLMDFSIINTPLFPPTPSIFVATPDVDDLSLVGTNYYSPSKDFAKDKVVKITDYIRVDPEKSNKKDVKELHEKVIDDLVSKAKEIIGIGKENQEDCAMKRRPSGKILSMVKIQMLTQCDKKLCENIPINEEGNFPSSSAEPTTESLLNQSDEGKKSDLKGELEEKRKRALRKIKDVKENLSQSRSKVTRSRKRKRSGPSGGGGTRKSSKSKSDGSYETMEDEKQSSWSDESNRKEIEIYHSTPYDPKKCVKCDNPDVEVKVNDETLNDIRQELPPYKDTADVYPELTEKSRKKIHYVGHFLKLGEVAKFLEDYDETNPPKLYLKPSFRRFFQVFYKWLKHPHKHELNASIETKTILKKYLTAFEKINAGLNHRNKRLRKSGGGDFGDCEKEPPSSEESNNNSGRKTHLSDDEEKDWKTKDKHGKKKDEDAEDGFVSILPLKKRKATVQQVELKSAPILGKNDSKNCPAENVSQTQNFLQDIDVDRFLSQIHGQANR